MNIRETTEKWEREYLSPYASLSENTRGRDREEPVPVWRGSIRGRGVWPASRRSVYPGPAGRPFKGAGADCG